MTERTANLTLAQAAEKRTQELQAMASFAKPAPVRQRKPVARSWFAGLIGLFGR